MTGASPFLSTVRRQPLTPTMTSESAIQHAIAQIGIIAVVRSRVAIESMLEVGDALLATPLTVLTVSPGSSQPWQTIAELRGRFGANMHVGAGPLSSVAQVATAVDAGTQFVLGACFTPQIDALCRRRGVLYLPGVATPAAAAHALRAGRSQQVFFPPGRDGVTGLQRLQRICPAARLLPMGGVTVDNLRAYAQAGAAGVVVRGVIGAQAKWEMASLITQMRRVRAAWEAGLIGRRDD